MKALKTVLAASALASIASAANATFWSITMTENTAFPSAGGPLIINLSGTYDDVAGQAVVGGHVSIPGFMTEIDYTTIVIDMTPATGEGFFYQPVSDASNCTANTTIGCAGFSQALAGPLYNDINFASTSINGNEVDQSTGTPFTVDGYMHIWTMVFSSSESGKTKLYQLPFTVCVYGWDSCLPPPPPTPTEAPLPTTVWLFGSGLLGLAGAARRRFK